MTFASIPKAAGFSWMPNPGLITLLPTFATGRLASNSWTDCSAGGSGLHLGARGHRRGPSGDDP